MENLLAYGAIFGALAFGFGLTLLSEGEISRKRLKLVFKILIQIIGVATLVCGFFSLKDEALLSAKAPVWVITLINVGLAALYTMIGCMLYGVYEWIQEYRTYGFRVLNKRSIRDIAHTVIIITTGITLVTYLFGSVPVFIYPCLVLIWGTLAYLTIALALGICGGVCFLIFHILKNFPTICKKYWKWLTK